MNFRTLRLGLKVTPCVAWAMLTWLKRYARHPERIPLEKRYKKVRKLVRTIIDHLELDVKFNNVDFINNQEKCFLGLSNHRHFIDPLFYVYFSEKPVSFVSKIENNHMIFVSDVMSCLECLYIDRDDIISQVRVFKKMAERIKNNEMTYFVFPEGTRMKDKSKIHTLPYKDGSIKPAYWANCNIVPCAVFGSDFMLEKKNKALKKRNITIEALPALKYEDYNSTPTTILMPNIEKDTNEMIKRLSVENLSRNRRKSCELQ